MDIPNAIPQTIVTVQDKAIYATLQYTVAITLVN